MNGVTGGGETGGQGEVGWLLEMMGWTCLEDCQYKCMHEVTAQDLQHNRTVRQFFGKWPFVRVLGIQEPASALFSVINAISVLVGYSRFSRQAPSSYFYHSIIHAQFLVTLNAWVWSTVFHCRDFPWTEKLDYFSATGLIVTGILVQFIRLTGFGAMTWPVVLYTGVWCLLFACHVSYLSLFKFDYSYNMVANVTAGVLYGMVWVCWCLKNRKRVYVWKCAAAVLATSALLSLELLDFPPLLWTLDAHALWHLSTAPLPLLWYSFLIDDVHYEAKNKIMKLA